MLIPPGTQRMMQACKAVKLAIFLNYSCLLVLSTAYRQLFHSCAYRLFLATCAIECRRSTVVAFESLETGPRGEAMILTKRL